MHSTGIVKSECHVQETRQSQRYHLCYIGVAMAVLLMAVTRGGASWLGNQTISLSSGHDNDRCYGAVRQSGKWMIIVGNEGAAAYGRYSSWEEHASGFGELYIATTSSNEYDDTEKAFAAGYVEGYLTASLIAKTAYNLEDDVQYLPFLMDQLEWMESMVSSNDPFWRRVGLLISQLRGLEEGAGRSCIALNWLGDLFDIKPAVSKSSREDFARQSPLDVSLQLQTRGHCSALVKVTADDILFGHSSWFHYSNMNRIYKHYRILGEVASFSSYPGLLSSLDDFYLMQKLVILQTTNGIYDQTLYDLITPHSLPAWIRVRVANALAKSAEDWTCIVAKHNSGTYNNQYLVLGTDTKQLWVCEQIPGSVVARDLTDVLMNQTYFASFNVPYFPQIYNASGYPSLDARKKQPVGSEYTRAPRNLILDRDHHEVHTLHDIRRIMRSNYYGFDDPLAPDPWSAVCARGDLALEEPSLAGCYDTKVSSLKSGMTAWVINGPTNDQQPTFSWADIYADSGEDSGKSWDSARASKGGLRGQGSSATSSITGSARHLGQPIVFDFAFEQIKAPPV